MRGGRALVNSARLASAISIERVAKRYGSKAALTDVSLEVRQGEIYGLLGPNGAGKSTMLRILATLTRPDSGRVLVGGLDAVESPREVRTRIGVALQETALDDTQRAHELLGTQARLHGMRRAEVRRRVAQALELVDLGEAVDRPVRTYSGGMRRRLDLAVALVHTPALLLLDEPTTGLDLDSRNAIWSELTRLNDEGTTILLTTQHLDEADALAHRVGFLAGGVLRVEGPPRMLKERYGRMTASLAFATRVDGARELLERMPEIHTVEAVDETTLRLVMDSDPVLLPRIVSSLIDSGADLARVECTAGRLDDVYRAVVAEQAR